MLREARARSIELRGPAREGLRGVAHNRSTASLLTRKAHPQVDSRPSEDQAAFAGRGRSVEGLALGLPSLSDPASLACPPPSASMKDTFSKNTFGTSDFRRRRKTSSIKPEFFPVIPVVFPAWDMSWHGKPPATSSVPLGNFDSVRMSPCTGTFGNREAKTARAAGSISHIMVVR